MLHIFKIIIILLLCLTGYLGVVFYLNINDKPAVSDAIVLFVGPDYDKRLQEAHQLMKEGYADILIVPAYRRTFVMSERSNMKKIYSKPLQDIRKKYPKYYENTHIELLEAQSLIEKNGLKSVIMVSSPNHMRRIKIISTFVFDLRDYSICFIGSRYLKKRSLLSIFNWVNIKDSFREMIKIFGFFAYRLMFKV
nr:ElyC/SanA/YdcF family protein [uncultured Desulfobacter sp.]